MTHPHVPGSVPLSSAAEVFEWAGRTLGDRARLVFAAAGELFNELDHG